MEGSKTLPSFFGVCRAGIGQKLFLDLLRVKGEGQAIVWEEFKDNIFVRLEGRSAYQTFLSHTNRVLGNIEVVDSRKESANDPGQGASCSVLPRIFPALVLVGEKLSGRGTPRRGALKFAPDSPSVLIFLLRWKDGKGLAEEPSTDNTFAFKGEGEPAAQGWAVDFISVLSDVGIGKGPTTVRRSA
jgi:hypothetical protein